ncbi:MAG: nitrous oxide-stimulated promoter family protein [Candidatus Amulumruptor caecigallinarius]|nr:nitrous oxide-stimulated promoter family protein [Candidatus Amulumruptor caecigallinarius]
MKRIEREKHTVEQMIRIYCRYKEGNRELCPDCVELLEYAKLRLSICPFGEDKSSCRKCRVHCYRPDMKEKIKIVMRYSGPRMIFFHPIAAVRHIAREMH